MAWTNEARVASGKARKSVVRDSSGANPPVKRGSSPVTGAVGASKVGSAIHSKFQKSGTELYRRELSIRGKGMGGRRSETDHERKLNARAERRGV